MPSRPATTFTPWRRRPRSEGCVVDEADHALTRGLAQLAQQAAAGAAGADDQHAAHLVRPRQLDEVRDRALREARGDDRERADERVDDEHAAREVADRRPA